MRTQPTIPVGSAAALFNDMINANFHANDELERAYEAAGVVGNVVEAVSGLRSAGVPITWITVQTPPAKVTGRRPVTDRSLREPSMELRGDPEWRAANIDALPIREGDRLLRKNGWDPFFSTALDVDLRQRGIRTILLGGVSTPGGVESCARSAFDRGYDVVVMSDCTHWIEEDLHRFTLERSLPRMARVMPSSAALDLLTP